MECYGMTAATQAGRLLLTEVHWQCFQAWSQRCGTGAGHSVDENVQHWKLSGSVVVLRNTILGGK
jgi:hypothetical protein